MNYLKNLLGNKCFICGEINNLEFDHIDPKTKSFTIGNKWSYSLDILLPEIEKCQLLCKTCHKEKNKTDNGEAHHGSLGMYRHRKCRCVLCKETHNTHRRKWRRDKEMREI